jgi:hemerythrin-like domain-containing protein
MKQPEPIKRSEQLAPLSREHHDALVFLLRIKQGSKNGTPIRIISEYINWFWANNLNNHIQQEERLLLPHLSHDDELARQLKSEHSTIRDLASRELSESEVVGFSNVLNAHIRFEERILFPHIERKISIDQLNKIFEQLDRPVQCQTGWHNNFWRNKKQ